MSEAKKLPLVIILGPTAVGKTSLSVALASRLDGEIVSADSRLLYRGMDIGTAKPTPAEMQGIPHHLIDMTNPDQSWSLAIYQREAYRIIDGIHSRGRLPFLVGGTGQYIRSIVEGWHIPPQKPDLALREAITHWADEIGAEDLYERLERIDPAAASNIDYRNLRRTVRALEVIFKTGERFSDLRRKQTCRYKPLILGIDRPRENLYERIDRRVEQMLDQGLVEEVRGLLDAGYSHDLPTLSAIGYAEIIQYLQGDISFDEAVALIKRNTRIFVRRQANWFKPDDKRITWFTASPHLEDEMEAYIRRNVDVIEK
jgi:tRNA dimethylallyltransferase